ncbi:hypothetical protein, partial [Protofrankia coriariae]|uniref:hypothetical protein n=1 Tax=Protofrankia coriariae TaxID=1562887 RepID=UPI001F443094
CTLFGRIGVYSDKLAMIFSGGRRPSTRTAVRDGYSWSHNCRSRTSGPSFQVGQMVTRPISTRRTSFDQENEYGNGCYGNRLFSRQPFVPSFSRSDGVRPSVSDRLRAGRVA